jgi:hypothetical protein
MILKCKGRRSSETSLGRRKELKTLPISEKLVMACQRLKNRKHKTKRRKSKQTRNQAEDKNQIQQMARNFKDPGRIATIPNDASSTDQ